MTTRIIGTGSYLPSTILTNEALSKIVETNDEWIQSRTGIKSRHIVKEETTTQLCTNAALKALEDANMKPEEVELIIVGTITADHVTPSAACEVQVNIGAHKAVAFDINAACSGFMYALHSAHAFLQANLYENALIIGAESLSKIIDWEDRSTCILFGDGAGAVVVKRDEVGILAIDQGSDGEKGKVDRKSVV